MGKIVPKKKFFKSSIYSPKLNVGSHIDNVKNSLERFIFSNEKEVEHALMKKRIRVVAVVTVLFMIVGSVLSPKGQAEIAVFYPTSCLGGWVNPRNAEGELQTTSNDITSGFTKENSAYLPATTSADIYCGGFKGTIEENTKPTKILVSLAWSRDGGSVTQHNVVGASFASSSPEILDSTSTESVSFTLSSSTEATSTLSVDEATSTIENNESATTSSSTVMEVVSVATTTEGSFVEKVVDLVGETLQKIFGEGESTTPVQENPPTSPVPAQEAVPQENNPPQPQEQVTPAPQEPAPSNTTGGTEPTSFINNVIELFTTSFIKRVFAEEVPVTSDTITTETSTLELSPTLPEIIVQESVSTTSDSNVVEDILPVQENTQPAVKQEEISSVSALDIVATSSTLDVASSTDNGTGTTESTSTQSLLDAALNAFVGENNETHVQNDFLEVLYTFDGVVWNSLGKVSEESMKYRTFEIPVTASTSWSDMGQLQIKVQSVQRIDATPEVYLDGIKVEVLYESPLTHEHPDFTRDTILKDETIDGIRVVRIVNNDTNEEEFWYMYLDDYANASSTDITATTTVIGTSTTLIASTTEYFATSTKQTINASSTNVGTSSEIIVKPEIIRNKWLKFEGEVPGNGDTLLIIRELEKIEKRKVYSLPDFTKDPIKKIKGTSLDAVIVQIEQNGVDSLWLFNTENNTQEKLDAGGITTFSKNYTFGIKGDNVFWLSEDGKVVFSYNIKTKNIEQQEIPEYDISKGERGEVTFPSIPWKVIIGGDDFTFFSEETGEIFSDDILTAGETFRVKEKLDTVLTKEKIEELQFIINEKTP